MPILEKIVIRDFRNIVLQDLAFSPNVNCISGNNGSGKTNLLEAIHYLSMTKSSASSIEKFNFRHGCSEFAIAGTYKMEGGLESRFAIQVSDDGKKVLKRDDKPYKRVSEHMGVLPIVMVSPADSSMVSESGEERRRFMNAVLSQTDQEYLDAVQQYNRLLQQRNKMLKDHSCDISLLEVFDMKMASLAEPIAARRRELCEALTPKVQEYYSALSGGGEQVCLQYETDLDRGPLDTLLAENRNRDLALRYTSVGIQRDDISFTMEGHPIRRCGSQGQQKSFLVSLKFAQYEIMKNRYGFAPILLLDDLFDKLDMNRVSNLLAMVAGSDFGQIFLTDSNKVRIAGIVDGLTKDRMYYETSEGTFKTI
ncbi:MAG: DNA replication and repair protein RecF [Bacteroidales bacterium]|nr:DNA replication and repair protein RecF [Bacteroidales bacterium]